MGNREYDLVVIGGGIVGLSTTRAMRRRLPGARIAVIEKEESVGRHQTGHNSGVIHSGIYYRPGSLKARLCVEGGRMLTDYCDEHGILYRRCGKVVVASDDRELPLLDELYKRGTANGVSRLRNLDRHELKDLEPHASGVAGLHSPSTGIVDFAEVASSIAKQLESDGVDVWTGHEVKAVVSKSDGLRVRTGRGEFVAGHLINCAGLRADIVARMMGVAHSVAIVPFRGEYYFLRPQRRYLVRTLIYPVPDPNLPFLGVHFTNTIHGEVEAGPNAVLAFAREGYAWAKVSPAEVAGNIMYPGFWRMARRFWRTGVYEFYRSLSKDAFVASLQKLVPEITAADVVRGGAGVRAQAIAPDGKLVDDFVILESERAVHILNAPSPAATASLAIGEYIADTTTQKLSLCTS